MAKLKKRRTQPVSLPMLPLRGLMVFPHMVLHFDVGRKKSIAALERAMEGDQMIFLVTQKDIAANLPEEKDLYQIGTLSRITQILRISQNTVRVMGKAASVPDCIACGRPSPFCR